MERKNIRRPWVGWGAGGSSPIVSQRPARDDGFTLVEVLTVVSIIGVLVLIAVASYAAPSARAGSVACAANIATCTRAVQYYSSEHDGNLPPNAAAIAPHLGRGAHALRCPAHVTTTYTYNPATGDVACPIHP